MQYETVLGPETDELPRTASGHVNPSGDAEKGLSGPTAAISGPGLGDLHTIDGGNREDVSGLRYEHGDERNARLIKLGV